MFFHNLKYTGMSIIKVKVSLFWTLIFPIALATFMYVAFGNLFEKNEIFKDIDVAVVDSKEDENLMTVLKSLESGDNELIKIHELSEDEAQEALSDNEVVGIIYAKDTSLLVKNSSIQASILESILRQYKQKNAMMMDIIKDHPENAQKVVESLTKEISYFKESTTSNGVQNAEYNYFYAIFAMSCMFAAFSSVSSTCNLQANTSSLGMRKNLAPHSKIKFILSEYLILLLIHFIVELISLGYMKVLGIDFGTKYPAIILTLLFGCMIGLSIGVIIGALPNIKMSGKIGIAISIGMGLSVMADLCVGGIKHMVENNIPILNRINPAVLISDCFYSLNVYDNYDRYFRNITILAIESAILLLVGFIMIRREKYASI